MITNDALEALEPLLRFLNLDRSPTSLDELAKAVDGYRIITVIASVSDPRQSRLGYDCDMAIEAIQRSIESEGYTLDRFRFPWLDPGSPAPPAQSSAASATGAATTPAAPGSGLERADRQPATILYRMDRPAPAAGKPPAPQDLLVLLLVGETPTWGIQQKVLQTSLDIAWTLDVRRNTNDPDHEPVIRLLAPTFSGSADSLARGLRSWAARAATGAMRQSGSVRAQRPPSTKSLSSKTPCPPG